MSETTVVHVRRDPYDIYIGRRNSRYKLPESKWSNPFTIRAGQNREQVIELYEWWLRKNPVLMAALPELKGKRLACWCHPKSCHGDVLARLADEAVTNE